MCDEKPVLAIICGGGPAPGLNGVIASATLYARRIGWKVLGFHDGYLHLSTGNVGNVKANLLELTEDIVSPVQEMGGSIIRCDRFDPTKTQQKIANVLAMLKAFSVRYLLIIGGNDKIGCTHLLTEGVDPATMQVICVPKTIDNDINLPFGMDTFGYHSARVFGTELVKNMMVDSKSAPRWFIVEVMGRNSGHLALSIQEASAAQLAIIPEDFKTEKITLSEICDIFEGAIIRRLANGKPHGVCIISEGLINRLTPQDLQALYRDGFITYGSDGEMILDDAEISRAISKEINKRMSERQLGIHVTPKKIGYELRSTDPNSHDSVYAQELGYGSIEGFRDGHSNCVVTWRYGVISFISFRDMMEPSTGAIFPRLVDPETNSYKISREYMWHVKPRHLKDPETVKELAKAGHLTEEEFRKKFEKRCQQD